MPGTSQSPEKVQNTSNVLTTTQQQVVKETWSLVYADAGTNGLELFMRLFRQIPHAKGYFEKFKDESEESLKQSELLKFHITKMMDSMNFLVGNLGNTDCLVKEIQTLARDHKERRVTSHDFKLVFGILQNLLKDMLGDKFDDVTATSWKTCCDIIWNIVDAEMQKT
ncbi:globin-like [Mercenaria mercenaria]|uniref:globin-like n=1 Tax=Mercenaria mercenaria TaxID=6596 RepID=UPI001E1D27B4|nr:globin-like [Mercenaria mercenaria]